MTNWKSRSYSKHSESPGTALKQIASPMRNQARYTNGTGNPNRENDKTDRPGDTMQGRTVINK
jgi:hypothetical protein